MAAMDDFDFDLDRSTGEAWAEFEARLAEVISMIDDSGDLTIGTESGSNDPAPFVRFSCPKRDRLRCEAAGNASLGPDLRLGPAQVRALTDLGWHPPEDELPEASEAETSGASEAESSGASESESSGASEAEIPGANDAGPTAPPVRDFWAEAPQEEAERLAAMAVAALRDVYGVPHPVFLAPDQLGEVLNGPTPVERVAGLPVPADGSRGTPQRLDALVDAELTDLYGHPPMRDGEGDVAVRVGSTMIFLRTSPDGQEVILFSAVVHDLAGRSRAAEVLNDLNVAARWVKFQLVRDRVFVTMSILARPFVPEHLRQAVRILSEVADGIDEELAAKLGGRTTFSEPDAG